ncbi:hypothetical protein LSAT2_032022 [Lamellibrachia satsuma]|nr:hypothetical protein LSAT2_032022 [Lamellibrachia satsuma]
MWGDSHLSHLTHQDNLTQEQPHTMKSSKLLMVFVVCVALAAPSRAWLFGSDDDDEEEEEEFTKEDFEFLRDLMPDMPTCEETCVSDRDYCVMFGCVEPHGVKRKKWCLASCAYILEQCKAECEEKGFILYKRR